jgi:hypothetical protein
LGPGYSAGGGGASIYWTKPDWQSGPGVPNDNARDVPDVSFSASPAHDPYVMISNGNAFAVGGTSVSTPVFAGMLAVLNQYLVNAKVQSKPGLGNINPMLYAIGRNRPGVFHDVTNGDNKVPCVAGSTQDCSSSGSFGYSAGTGYDLATGWGSVDAVKLAAAFGGGVSNAQLVYSTVTQQEWNGKCDRNYYTPNSFFFGSSKSANVYFEINSIGSYDQVTSQWLKPDGSVYASGTWASTTGNRCFEDRIGIAGKASASPGNWRIRVLVNGSAILELPFTVSPVSLTNSMVTKSVDASSCTTPTPAATISTSDSAVWLWFSVTGAQAGDAATAAWNAPDGSNYASGSWQPLAAAGSYCFYWSMSVAGRSPSTNPGNWSVSTAWNGVPMFTTSFTISNQ